MILSHNGILSMGVVNKTSSGNYLCVANTRDTNKSRNKTISIIIMDDTDTEPNDDNDTRPNTAVLIGAVIGSISLV